MDYIAIVGKMASGKSTLANKINRKIYNNNGCVSSFAGAMKEIVKNRELLLDYTIKVKSKLNENETEEVLLFNYAPFMNILSKLDAKNNEGKLREHYQFVGEFFKKVYGQDFWINKFFKDFKDFNNLQNILGNKIDALIIDDLRMKIEYKSILNKSDNFIILALELKDEERLKVIEKENLGSMETLNHISETEPEEIIDEIKSFAYENMYQYDNDKRIITIYSTKNKINKKFLNKLVSLLN